MAEYVQTLEEARDTADLPEASGDAIAREFERYLRRRDPAAGPAADPGDGSYFRDLSGGRAQPKPRPDDVAEQDGPADGPAGGEAEGDGAGDGETPGT